MPLNSKPKAHLSISNSENLEISGAQSKALSSLNISTKFRSKLSRKDRPNSVPCKTVTVFAPLKERSEALKSMRSVSYNETLIKSNNYELVPPEGINSPGPKSILEDKCLEHSATQPSVEYLPTSTRKNSKMRIMSDKLQLKFLSRKPSKGKISAPTLIMASSNIQTFNIENPAHELSFAQRLDAVGSNHFNTLRGKLQTSSFSKKSNENVSSFRIKTNTTKDQIRALTFATLNGYSNQEYPGSDSIGNLNTVMEAGLPKHKSKAGELSFARDVETLLQYLTTKTQEEMYRASIYDLYDYTSEEEEPEIGVDSDFNLDLALAHMMLNTSTSTPIFTQSTETNTLVE